MKRFLLFCAILLTFVIAAPAHAQTPMGHLFTCLTGGTTGCMDKVDAEDLSDGMFALVVVGNVGYIYQYDADSLVADDGITAIRPDYYTTPTVPWSQGVWLLVGTTSRDVLPGAADTYTLGSATREWANLYLGDSAVIYGQNDQSATLTSSASKWTANNFGVSTQFQLPSSNADPTATAGYLRHDSTVSNHANGALRWHDGTAIRQIIDMVAATAEGCTDTQVVAYSATNDNFYCKDDLGAAGIATDTLWDAAGDLAIGTGANTGGRLAIGTAGQVLQVNAGVTAPEWTASLGIANLTVSTQFKLPSSNADPTATAGYLRHDSTVTNHANGALRWHDGTNIRQLVDMVGTTAEGCTDTQVVAYSATNDNFYCKDDGGGSGDVATDTIWDAAGDTVYGTGSNTAARLALGTAGQIYKVNAGATAPEWSSSLAIVSISSGAYWTDGATGGAYIQLREDTDNGTDSSNFKGADDAGTNPSFKFYGSAAGSEDLSLTATADTWTFSSSTGVTTMGFSALNLATTGTIDGGIPVTESASSPVTVSGMTTFYTNAQDAVITFNLPATPTNKAYCFANVSYARAITVNPDDADVILMGGTAGAAGEAIVSSGAAADMVCVVGINASTWRVTAKEGTWAQESP